MTQHIAHLEATLKREITQLYKTYFGKGPIGTTVKVIENLVMIKLSGALSQIEESLMTSLAGKELVMKIRDEMLLGQRNNYIPMVEKVVRAKVDDVCYVMGKKDAAMYMFLVFENDIDAESDIWIND